MGRFFQFYFLFFLTAAAFSFPAMAQEEEGQPGSQRPYAPYEEGQGRIEPDAVNPLARPTYEWMARQALKNRPPAFDFTAFRGNYARTDYYDPLGEEARSQALKLAYEVQNAADPEKRKTHLAAYGEWIVRHLGNIDLVTQAAALAAEDERLGDPEFFRWMRAGLLRSVMDSGDGENLYRAYDVIALGEETALLKALRVKDLGVEAVESGGTYYNMHSVDNGRRAYTVFVDVTIPMTRLEAQKRARGGAFSMPAKR